MEAFVTAGRVVGFGFLGGMAAVILLGLLKGRINLANLLDRRAEGAPNAFSTGRAQSLVMSIVAAGVFLQDLPGSIRSGRLADVPPALLTAFGASQALYLTGKLRARFEARSRK